MPHRPITKSRCTRSGFCETQDELSLFSSVAPGTDGPLAGRSFMPCCHRVSLSPNLCGNPAIMWDRGSAQFLASAGVVTWRGGRRANRAVTAARLNTTIQVKPCLLVRILAQAFQTFPIVTALLPHTTIRFDSRRKLNGAGAARSVSRTASWHNP